MGEPRQLVLGGVRPPERSINLRDLGFRFELSEKARAEIAAAERRRWRVLETAHLYWFR